MEKEQTNENSWEFHLTDKIAQLSKMTLEMHTEFWLSTLQTWFHGYQTPEEYKATIWGREVDLCISIAPLETPTEKLPIIEEKSEKGKNELLPPEQQAYVDELKKKIKALKKLLPPKVDEALEQRYLDYMNAERIKAIIQDCTKIWSNPDLPVEEKISQLIPYKIELYACGYEYFNYNGHHSILCAKRREKCEEKQNKNTQAGTSISEIYQ